jgi:diacylglycerol kinase (ATP)
MEKKPEKYAQEKSKKFSAKSRMNSFSYAFKGVKAAFDSEHNLWIHFSVTVMVILAGFAFNITKYEWLILLLIITIVIVTEFFNTAIETIINLVSPGYHPLAGKAKDVAAGAVLITAVVALIVGAIIFLPYVLELF